MDVKNLKPAAGGDGISQKTYSRDIDFNFVDMRDLRSASERSDIPYEIRTGA